MVVLPRPVPVPPGQPHNLQSPRYNVAGFHTEPPFDGWSYSSFIHPRTMDWKDISGHPREYMSLGFSLQPTYCQPGSFGHPATWFTEIGMPFYAVVAITAILPAYQGQRLLRR